MPSETIELTIVGGPGEEVQVWYRGNMGDDPDLGDPAPIVYTGKLGIDGRVTISVPRAYLVLGRPVKRAALPLPLHEEIAASKTVELPPEK